MSSGTLGDLVNLQPMAFQACQSPAVPLASGNHVMTFPAGSALRMTSLLGDSPTTAPTVPSSTTAASDVPPRSVRVAEWAAARRTVDVGPGSSSYLQVSQNFSSGWVAVMGGRTLKAVQLDGWQQGWIVPAGSGGTVTLTFIPDQTYRLGLALGAFFLLVLAYLAIFGRRRSSYEAVGPRRHLPFAVLVASALAITVIIGGPVMGVLLVPLLYAARRWGSALMAAVAGSSFLAAGLIVALHPNGIPGYHLGAFSAPVQFLSVVAIGAVMCTVVFDGREKPADVSEAETSDV
jgi:arabinofuranan 3-O-arabinosyltransferase